MSELPDDVLFRVTVKQLSVAAQQMQDGLEAEYYGQVDYRALHRTLSRLRDMGDCARVLSYRLASVQGKKPVGAPPRKARSVQASLEVL